MEFNSSAELAARLDEADPLKSFRERFYIPTHAGSDCIYFTGNSLGLQPRSVSAFIQQELDDWARLGVEGHFHAKNPWMPYHEKFSQQLAAIIGCLPHETVAMNQLTVNLHLLMVSFYRPTPQRYKIICEAKAFPSDQYALESQVRHHGFDPADAIIEVTPRPGEHCIREEDILLALQHHGQQVALLLFGGVNYYTGQRFNLDVLTDAAHKAGAFAGFDLAHAAGNTELFLHDWNVDFACWCSYKYLNSGPGGVAGIYIHEKHAANRDFPRFAGWWGYDKETRFRMEKGFRAIPTAEGWQLSNAPVLSMAAHQASLQIFEEAGMEKLHAKRHLLAAYLRNTLDEINASFDQPPFEIITPVAPGERGCQVSLLVRREGRYFFEQLTKKGVIADWREPDVVRVAPVPLYNTFTDIREFGEIIRTILHS